MDFLYPVVLSLIRKYKWVEFQVLKLFEGPMERKAIEIGESLGASIHFVDSMEDKVTWSEEDDLALLTRCATTYGRKFPKVLHIKVVKNKNVIARIANLGSLAFGETFMDNLWALESQNPEEDTMQFATRFFNCNMLDLFMNKWNFFLNYLETYWANMQTRARSMQIAEHYDLGNDLFELMLDEHLQYTCGYWPRATNLNEAQEDKLDLIAQKLQLKPGMTLLDVGCGWGGLCAFMAKRYGVRCVGVTISKEQAQYARERCKGLDVEIRVQDYRDVNEKFDRMTVVGMLEHVGYRNYDKFFEIAHRNLKDDGIFLLHMIGINQRNLPQAEKFYLKYIFPNSNLPYPSTLAEHVEKRFVIEDWHNFGADYVPTLAAWREKFIRSWPQLQNKYGDRFYRMWIYYLTLSEGLFRSRKAQLWQLVLTKDGKRGGYRAPR